MKELEIWIFQHRPGSAEVERLLQMNRMDPHIAPNHVSVAEPFFAPRRGNLEAGILIQTKLSKAGGQDERKEEQGEDNGQKNTEKGEGQ